MASAKTYLWGMYDLANTIYSALFVTFFFPLFVKNYLGGTEFLVGATFSVSMLLVGLFVPALGAFSDMLQRRMPFIVVFTILNCIFVAFVPSVSLWWALLLALLANFCYHAALNSYNALLPQVSIDNKVGEASGIGVAMGYLGTILSLAVAYLVFNFFGWETRIGLDAMFYTTSILFFGLALFMFLGVKEPRAKKIKATFSQSLGNIVSSVKAGVLDIIGRKALRSFLIAAFCFTNAMNAVIIFLFLYGQTVFGLTVKSFFPVYAVFALGAAGGSWIMAKAIDLRGPRWVLFCAGWTWVVVVCGLLGLKWISLLGIEPYYWFLFCGVFGGAALGMVWSSNRAMLVSLVPPKKLAQYFGFLELTDKFSGVIGPLVFGFFATYYGYTYALLSLLVFFGLGLLFLKGTPYLRQNSCRR